MAKRRNSTNVEKCIMSLESEKNLYVTGSTILAMKGIISYEEYMTNKFKKNIGQDILDKKYYLQDILGAMRGMTRLKIISSNDRSPSVTMFKRMKEEDDEIVANGWRFSSDSDCSSDRSLNSSSEDLTLSEQSKSNLLSKDLPPPSKEGVNQSMDFSKKKWLINKIFTLNQSNMETTTEMENGASKCGERSKEDEQVVQVNNETENSLPQELLNCGDCGARISSIDHLHIHLERCRGTKRKRRDSFKRRKRVSTDKRGVSALSVCDTDDGEVIEGWWPSMGAVPPGPTCPRCAFEVPTLYDLPLHQKHHTGSENITCPVCTFSTISLPDYLFHVEEHAS